MKKLFFAGITLLLTGSVWAQERELPHLPLDMDGYEYRAFLEKHPEFLPEAADELQDILQWGKRNLEWIDAVNATRDRNSRLELSTPQTTKAYPVESPKESNREIVMGQYKQLNQTMPEALQDILLGSGSIPNTLPMNDEEFLTWARKVDSVYQSASRWLLQEGRLSSYAARSYMDIRGFYFLRNIDDLRNKLQKWLSLDTGTQSQWRLWLISVCRNNIRTQKNCEETWEKDINTEGNPVVYYDRYWEEARKLFDSFFLLRNPRRDAEFRKPNDFVLPFRTPENDRIENWLRENIEDEWRLGEFHLRLRFEPEADPRVVFDPGATPNVNGLGGNTITMDANRDLDEYINKWIIRHEFGHVIGFPDCYVEFYDTTKAVMVNYQIDINNIMCSRRGHLQAQHVEELRRTYPDYNR